MPDAIAIVPAATGGRRIWLRVGTLLDGCSTAPLPNAHVVYNAQQVLFVGENSPPRDVLGPDQRTPDADLPDYTLLPGLIDAHTHLFLEGGELDPAERSAYLQQSPAQLLDLARPRLEKLLRLGIVACRDAGDKDGVGLALARLSASPAPPLVPYIDSPGAAIHHHGRYGSFIAEPLENFPSPHACVEARVRAGADRIKLIPTGIIDFKAGAVASTPQMTTEEIRALVSAAQAFGKQTFAHASGDSGIDRTIDGGVDTIEHGFFLRDDQLARMRDRNIAWVPTFAPVQKQLDHADRMGHDSAALSNLKKILDQHAATLLKAHQLGVTILAGSDAGSYGVPHGLGLQYELQCIERAGLSPLTVLNAATGAPSQRLAFKDNFGQIRPGCRSRFILTQHSPLNTIANLQKPRTVLFDGAVLPAEAALNPSGL
jgi:imidazolonepropionase-like amidohydrolase